MRLRERLRARQWRWVGGVRSACRETRPTFLPRSSSAWEVKVKEQKEKYSVEKLMVKKIEAVEKENLGLQSIYFFFLSLFTCFFRV